MIPLLVLAHFLVTPAGEVILKLFLRADLDVAEVAHLGAFFGLLDLREMLPAR